MLRTMQVGSRQLVVAIVRRIRMFAVYAVGAAASFKVSCSSVTMIDGVRAHGELYGLSGSDIGSAISLSRACEGSGFAMEPS